MKREIHPDMTDEEVQRLAYPEPLLLKQRWLEHLNILENTWAVYRNITDTKSRGYLRKLQLQDKRRAETMIQSVTIKLYMALHMKMTKEELAVMEDLDAIIPYQNSKMLELRYLFKCYKTFVAVLNRMGLYKIERLPEYVPGRQLV